MSEELNKDAQTPPSEPEQELAEETELDDLAEFDVEDFLQQFKAVQSELETAKQAQADAESRVLRLQADFDNYRRRQRLENEETVKQAAAGLAGSILPVLDNFQRALEAMSESADRDGVELIAKQLWQIMETAGVEEIAALDAEFDPKLHQAVLQSEAGPDKAGRVTMVLQKGYTFHGKLLRAAMVQVGM